MKIALVVGARPNFVKAAPLARALCQRDDVEVLLIHSGQHYDDQMSGRFFDELKLPPPDVNLEVGSGGQAEQIGLTMLRLRPTLATSRADVLVVVGDVNATTAAALTAQEFGIPVAHVEAGLRSFDRTMPEEINRLVVDAVADAHFTTSVHAEANLRREGIPAERICLVGNIMIDALVDNLDAARSLGYPRTLGLADRSYALVTLHRPGNVDLAARLRRLIDVLDRVLGVLPVVFPLHPRTRRRLEEAGMLGRVAAREGLHLLPPLSYREFLALEASAALVITDSGGVQEETTFLGIPCLTVRENTERPETVWEGTNAIVGADVDVIMEAVQTILGGGWKTGRIPALWDGKTAHRIVDELLRRYGGRA